MVAIVEQLQKEALATTTSVSTLLRKVKLVASKLELPSIEEWVLAELNGYTTTEIPDYRILRGQPRAHNPYRGWIPIIAPARAMSRISTCRIPQSLPTLESIIADLKNGASALIPYTPHEIETINQGSEMAWAEMGVEVGKAQLFGIVDRVRTLVLDWSLELERQGILGSEIGFRLEEKELARKDGVNIHIGTIESFTGALTARVAGKNSRLNIGGSDGSKNHA